MYGRKIKTWKLNEKEKMQAWIRRNERKYQINEVFICNLWAVEYKPLLHI